MKLEKMSMSNFCDLHKHNNWLNMMEKKNAISVNEK